MQVSVGYNEQPLITLRHGHQWGALGGGMFKYWDLYVCLCVCVRETQISHVMVGHFLYLAQLVFVVF